MPDQSLGFTGTVLTATYRARGYDADDEQTFRRLLGAIGPVRLRALQLPEAGGSFEFWLTILFVGKVMAEGIVGNAAWEGLKKIGSALKAFFKHKASKASGPEMALTLSFDDIDIEFPEVTVDQLDRLPALGEKIHGELQKPTFEGKAVTRIVVGLGRGGGDWYVSCAANPVASDERFWAVSLEGHRVLTHVYDCETGLLSAVNRIY